MCNWLHFDSHNKLKVTVYQLKNIKSGLLRTWLWSVAFGQGKIPHDALTNAARPCPNEPHKECSSCKSVELSHSRHWQGVCEWHMQSMQLPWAAGMWMSWTGQQPAKKYCGLPLIVPGKHILSQTRASRLHPIDLAELQFPKNYSHAQIIGHDIPHDAFMYCWLQGMATSNCHTANQ